jgi:hypothetical protein
MKMLGIELRGEDAKAVPSLVVGEEEALVEGHDGEDVEQPFHFGKIRLPRRLLRLHDAVVEPHA